MPWGRRCEGKQSFAASSRALARWATLRAHRAAACWRWRIELCRILRTGLGLGTGLSVKVLPMTSIDDAPKAAEALGYKTNPPPTEAEREAQQAQLLEDHPPPYEALRLRPDGRVDVIHHRRPPSPDCALRVRIRAVRPVSRRRGAGSPSRRRTAAASTGGSSDDPGEPAPGEKPPADVDVFVVVGEDHRQVALRLALVLTYEVGEVVLSTDDAVRDLVDRALPVALGLLRGRGQTAAAAPTIFSDAWSIVIGEVTR